MDKEFIAEQIVTNETLVERLTEALENQSAAMSADQFESWLQSI